MNELTAFSTSTRKNRRRTGRGENILKETERQLAVPPPHAEFYLILLSCLSLSRAMGSNGRRQLDGASSIVNPPVAIGVSIVVYWLLVSFLLGGSGFFALLLSSMAMYSLVVATLSHPGKVPPPADNASLIATANRAGDVADNKYADGTLLLQNNGNGIATTTTAMTRNSSSAVTFHLAANTVQNVDGAQIDSHVIDSRLNSDADDDGEEGDSAELVGHFRPKRAASVPSNTADDGLLSQPVATKMGSAIINMVDADGRTVATSPMRDNQTHLSASNLSSLAQRAGGLLSLAVSKIPDVTIDDVRTAGMVTPTLSEASMATSNAASVAGLSKKEKRERKEQKQREKLDKKLAKEGRKKDPLFCRSCDSKRPPRTHHCRVCDDCVVRYDHHCIWINNCVGAANIKSFFLFLLYTCIGIVHFVFSSFGFISSGHMFSTIHQQSMGYFLALVWLAFIPICLGGSLVAFSFLLSTFKGLAGNYTTYELTWEPVAMPAAAAAGSGGATAAPLTFLTIPPSRYDKGNWLLNLKATLGEDPLVWWMPTAGESTSRTLNQFIEANNAGRVKIVKHLCYRLKLSVLNAFSHGNGSGGGSAVTSSFVSLAGGTVEEP